MPNLLEKWHSHAKKQPQNKLDNEASKAHLRLSCEETFRAYLRRLFAHIPGIHLVKLFIHGNSRELPPVLMELEIIFHPQTQAVDMTKCLGCEMSPKGG
jgi:hypothetical protein